MRQIRKTPREKDWTAQLKYRNATKLEEIAKILEKLNDGRIALDAMKDEKQRLEQEKLELLDENNRTERQLQELVFPDLTEVDVDLYFAGSNNPHDLYLKMQCCDARYQKARENLVRLFSVHQKCEKIREDSLRTPTQVAQLAEILVELRQRVRAEYKSGHSEYERLKTLAQEQDQLVNQLQTRIQQIDKGLVIENGIGT